MKDFKSFAEKEPRHGEFKSCQTAETIETQWNQHWKFTDGETVAGQASQGFVENYCSSGMIFKGLEVLWETWKSTWQRKLCWISERKKISQDRIRWNMKEDRIKV